MRFKPTVFYLGKPLVRMVDKTTYRRTLQRHRAHPEYTIEQCVENDELFPRERYKLLVNGTPLKKLCKDERQYNNVRHRAQHAPITLEQAMKYGYGERYYKHKRTRQEKTDYARYHNRKKSGCPKADLFLSKQEYRKKHPCGIMKYTYQGQTLSSYCKENKINYDKVLGRFYATGIKDFGFLIETLDNRAKDLLKLYEKRNKKAYGDGGIVLKMDNWGQK